LSPCHNPSDVAFIGAAHSAAASSPPPAIDRPAPCRVSRPAPACQWRVVIESR
jgi:hypothetical protein